MRSEGASRGVRQGPGQHDRHPEILGRIPRSRGPQPLGCGLVPPVRSVAAFDYLLEKNCTGNVIHLNHPQTTPFPVHGKLVFLDDWGRVGGHHLGALDCWQGGSQLKILIWF